MFAQDRFIMTEALGSVPVHLVFTKGKSLCPFSIIVIASEQSPVSALGK